MRGGKEKMLHNASEICINIGTVYIGSKVSIALRATRRYKAVLDIPTPRRKGVNSLH